MIIPTRHRNDDLGRCLDRLAPDRQEGAWVVGATRPEAAGAAERVANFEVIVTDDGTDGTAESMLRERYPWARWTAGPRRGPAANRNHGAAQATGTWLVFLDDDCRPESGLIRAYHASALRGDHPVLEGRISPEGQRTRFDMECPANETGGFLWSCNFAIRRELFRELGGFDEAFPGPAMEDVDLRTRLAKQGINACFVASARVHHPWRMRKGLHHVRRHVESVSYFIAKHPEMRSQFSWQEIGYGLLRRFCRHYPGLLWRCGGRGLVRDLGLACYGSVALVRVARKSGDRARALRVQPMSQAARIGGDLQDVRVGSDEGGAAPPPFKQ